MKTNFRVMPTCSTCAHARKYDALIYCASDGNEPPKMPADSHGGFAYNEAASDALVVLQRHWEGTTEDEDGRMVCGNGVCDEWRGKE